MLKSKVGVVYQVIMGVSLGGGKDEILLESIPASLGLDGGPGGGPGLDAREQGWLLVACLLHLPLSCFKYGRVKHGS